MGELILWKQITAELNGHTVTGLYSTVLGLVTVSTPYDSEQAVRRIEQYVDRQNFVA
ncbi:MAG: hypothetical protein WBG18_16110 [Xanthobacteraceae bacterium]